MGNPNHAPATPAPVAPTQAAKAPVAPVAAPVVAAAEATPGLVLRPYRGPEDHPAMVEINNRVRAAAGSPDRQTVAGMDVTYANATGCDPHRDALVAELDGRPVAYGRTIVSVDREGERIADILCFVAPDVPAVAASLLAALEERHRERAADLPAGTPLNLQTYALHGDTAGTAAIRHAGYRPIRAGYLMVRPNLEDIPDLPLPDGLEIRPVEEGHLRAIWEAEVEAFRDHWGAQADPSEESWRRFLDDPTNDTSLWRIAWAGDQVAGQVRSFVNEEENTALGVRRGWTESISVRRPWRRLGLASALLAASLHALRERGYTSAALGVDAENESGALGFYERLGFRIAAGDTIYRKVETR